MQAQLVWEQLGMRCLTRSKTQQRRSTAKTNSAAYRRHQVKVLQRSWSRGTRLFFLRACYPKH